MAGLGTSFLRYTITRQGIKPIQKIVTSILEYKHPRTLHELLNMNYFSYDYLTIIGCGSTGSLHSSALDRLTKRKESKVAKMQKLRGTREL